jgi:hypothetical protein
MKKTKLSREEIKNKLESEEDFVNSPKHDYSLSKLERVNPNGVNDRFAASLLAITVEEFQSLFQSTVKKYRQLLKIDVE